MMDHLMRRSENGEGKDPDFLSSSSRFIIILSLSLWVIFMLLLYALNAHPVEKLLKSYREIFFMLLLLTSAFFLGSFFTGLKGRRFRISEITIMHPVSIGIGSWVFSLIALMLAVLGFLSRWVVLTIISMLLISFFCYIIRFRKERELSSTKYGALEKILTTIMWMIVILTFLFSFRPPVHYDALEYHLSVPAEFIKNGGLVYLPHDVQSNFPMNVEMLYLLSLLLSGWKVANFINFAFLPLIIALVYSFSKRFFGARSALFSALIVSSLFPIMELSTHPLVDLEFAFFTVASFLLAIFWLYEKNDRYLYLSALLSGIALGIKYTALIFTLPLNLLFFILFIAVRREKTALNLMKMVLVILIMLAAASPWLIRNYINTGNPIFPAASKYLGHEIWTEQQDRLLKKAANESPRDLAEIWNLPYRMSFSSSDFGSFSWVGPVFLIFLPLIFVYKKERLDYILILYALLYFLLWAFSFNMMRFAVPLMVILSILSGRAIHRYAFEDGSLFIRRFLSASLVVIVAFNALYFLSRQASLPDSMKVVFGIESERSFLSRYLEYYDAVDFYNKIAEKDSRILFIGEARTFYCKSRAVWSSAYNENPIIPIIRESELSVEISRKLHSLGITHILYAPREVAHLHRIYGAYNLNEKEEERFLRFLKEETTSLFSEGGIHLLQIKTAHSFN
ncbi:MAG: glycosyltransferase family 39 protein [Acidobacteriota bacterium]